MNVCCWWCIRGFCYQARSRLPAGCNQLPAKGGRGYLHAPSVAGQKCILAMIRETTRFHDYHVGAFSRVEGEISGGRETIYLFIIQCACDWQFLIRLLLWRRQVKFYFWILSLEIRYYEFPYRESRTSQDWQQDKSKWKREFGVHCRAEAGPTQVL